MVMKLIGVANECGDDDDGGWRARVQIFIVDFQSDTKTNWWHCPKMHINEVT